MRLLASIAVLIWPFSVVAAQNDPSVPKILDQHILPGFERLAMQADGLKATAGVECGAGSTALRRGYHDTFDAWVAVSHLRFGPTEAEDRAFAMAFWPDKKGFTPKALKGLIGAEDAAVFDPAAFASVSIAARGLFALEYLLFDEMLRQTGTADYRCALVLAIATDIDRIADDILSEWHGGYGDLLRNPGVDSPYRSDDEAVQEMYKALLTGLQFTSEARLGRPLGTFDKPRPRRAEARRSDRPLRNLTQSLKSLEELALLLSQGRPNLNAAFASAFARSFELAQGLDDPSFAGVATPQGRLRTEILQQSIDQIRELATTDLSAALGVAAGFNALDGD